MMVTVERSAVSFWSSVMLPLMESVVEELRIIEAAFSPMVFTRRVSVESVEGRFS